MAPINAKAVTIQIVGVGGQGALTMTKVIGAAAIAKDMPVVMSEIHGMSQRGGVVQTTIRLGDAHSPLPFSFDNSIMVAFEPMEAYRAKDIITSETIVVINRDPIRPVSVSSGGMKYPDIDSVVAEIGRFAKKVHSLSALDLAIKAGDSRVTNMVLLGAMAACGVLPFTVIELESAIRASVPPKAMESNMRAFMLGLESVRDDGCEARK
jgi:indolepyruvate ferredoxin oxidoreductase, beta subunit